MNIDYLHANFCGIISCLTIKVISRVPYGNGNNGTLPYGNGIVVYDNGPTSFGVKKIKNILVKLNCGFQI